MPVSASKLVTLAQLQVQAERVKQELAKYTLASELGSLAKKSEISEADLSAALKSVIDGKMDAADSMTTEAINSAIATAIAKSAHARFEKVEKVPSNDEAQDNVLYLVMNAATGYYDIYAKVGEEVVRLDDTTVDLSNYATIEQLNAVSGGIGGTVYAGTKEDLSASDDSVIAAYFKAHTDVAVKKGDVFVVTTTVGNSTYEKSAYFYDGKAWVAMTGSVDADKVILRDDITLAGGYTQVGNLTKSQNGTAQTISSKSVNITVPTKVGDLTNDQKFQTETQVSTAISKAVAAADHLKRKVVNSTADIDLKAADASQYIYMVSKGTAGEADKYDEYMVIDGVLEKMGDWGVDLSGYVQKETGKGLSTNDYTTAEKTKLGGIEEGANKYTHPTHTAAASGLYKVTVDALGHVTATTKVVKNDITGLGIPAQDTTYTEVTQSANGLMTASDKTKLDGMTIATDAEVTEMLTEVFGATA